MISIMNKMTISAEFSSSSPEETHDLGQQLGAVLRPGDLIGLRGDLGAGKTTLVRGVAEGFGIPVEKVKSPSFTMINEYSGMETPFFHIDLYRLDLRVSDMFSLREYLYGDGVCLVEWAERLGEDVEALHLSLTFVAENRRKLVATASSERYKHLVEIVARYARDNC